jgi:hypothetical protein
MKIVVYMNFYILFYSFHYKYMLGHWENTVQASKSLNCYDAYAFSLDPDNNIGTYVYWQYNFDNAYVFGFNMGMFFCGVYIQHILIYYSQQLVKVWLWKGLNPDKYRSEKL